MSLCRVARGAGMGLRIRGIGLEDRLALELAIGPLAAVRKVFLPVLPIRIGLLKHSQNLHIPRLRIAPVGLRLDVGPPHVLLTLAEGPRGLAGHGATLAGNATINVEDERELPLRKT